MANAHSQFHKTISKAGSLDHHWHQNIHSAGLAFATPPAQMSKAFPKKRLKSSCLSWVYAQASKSSSPNKNSSDRLSQVPLWPVQQFAFDGATVPRTPLCRNQALREEPAHSIASSADSAHENGRWPVTPDYSEAEPSSQARNNDSGRIRLDDRCRTPENGSGSLDRKQVAAWFPVDPVWQATEQEALRDERLRQLLAPAWRVLLLSDGSVTRHLQLLSDFGSVTADCFQMEEIGENLEGLPPGAELVPGPRVQRQVWLRTSDGQPLVYAASWWSSREVAGYLKEVQKPIWVNLSETRAELYRDVQRLYLGHSEELERAFGVRGPFWARHYVFYHDGRPLTLIYEVFSKSLERYIGPMQPKDPGEC